MFTDELIETMDYLREVERSTEQPLGTALRQAQLQELDKVIRRLSSVANPIPDPRQRAILMALKRRAMGCYCRILFHLLTHPSQRACITTRVA